MAGDEIVALKQPADASALFDGLGTKFGIQTAIVDYLVKDIGLGSFEGFLFTFAKAPFFAQVSANIDGPASAQKLLQVGKLR